MCAILKGRDTDLGRDLAIKVLLDSHKDKPEMIQRFIEEAQIEGQLQHPGIAPVYELGQFSDQRPFFRMKLVKGQTLSELLVAAQRPDCTPSGPERRGNDHFTQRRRARSVMAFLFHIEVGSVVLFAAIQWHVGNE